MSIGYQWVPGGTAEHVFVTRITLETPVLKWEAQVPFLVQCINSGTVCLVNDPPATQARRERAQWTCHQWHNFPARWPLPFVEQGQLREQIGPTDVGTDVPSRRTLHGHRRSHACAGAFLTSECISWPFLLLLLPHLFELPPYTLETMPLTFHLKASCIFQF